MGRSIAAPSSLRGVAVATTWQSRKKLYYITLKYLFSGLPQPLRGFAMTILISTY
ncbi:MULTISPECIES: hypothetical protein [unclassified Rickettsia]|uniref:hypothetical protein n=1 Tax=unclassified Rickettsia TaxID=114295 RepID=UPI003132D94D